MTLLQTFENLTAKLRAGMKEREARRIFEFEAFARGIEKAAKVQGVSGRGGYPRYYGVPSGILSDGDILFVDGRFLFDYYSLLLRFRSALCVRPSALDRADKAERPLVSTWPRISSRPPLPHSERGR